METIIFTMTISKIQKKRYVSQGIKWPALPQTCPDASAFGVKEKFRILKPHYHLLFFVVAPRIPQDAPFYYVS